MSADRGAADGKARLEVRAALESDLPAITAIYNDAVVKTTATFDLAPRAEAEQAEWFREHGPRHPILIAEDGGRVAGWASLSAWSGRCAYADTAELSVYVAEGSRGRGVGRRLAEAVLAAGREAGLHTVLSRIAEGSDASVRLHEALGFRKIGVMREVGRKFGHLLDVHLYQYFFVSNGK